MLKKTLTRSDTLPVTVDEFALWSRLEDTALEADLLAGLLKAGTEAAEQFTGRTITPETAEYSFPLQDKFVSIPTLPVGAITKVEAEAEDGTRTLLSMGEDYRERLTDFVANVRLVKGRSEPLLVITVDAGYSNTGAIPQPIKQAITIHAASAYLKREGEDEDNKAFERLLRPYCLGVM